MHAPGLASVPSSSKATIEPVHRFGAIIAETVKKIVGVSEHCLSTFRDDYAVLERGIWYQNEFYRALSFWAEKKPEAAERLKKLVEAGDFYHPHPPAGFNRIKDTASISGKKASTIVIKRDASPSAALDGIVDGDAFALLDCATVCHIAVYRALQKVLGNEKFDILFCYEGKYPLLIGDSLNPKHPLMHFFKIANQRGTKPGNRAVRIGDSVSFLNTDMYGVKHYVMGEAKLLNTVCVSDQPGKQTFVGLGTQPDGESEQEIEEGLIREYNAPPVDSSSLGPELAKRLFDVSQAKVGAFPTPEIHTAVCRYLESQTSENETKLKQEYLRVNKQENFIQSALDHIKNTAFPITVEDVKVINAPFGIKDEVLSYNLDFINRLARMSIDEVSHLHKNKT